MATRWSNLEEQAFTPEWHSKAELSYHTVEEYGAQGNIWEDEVLEVLQGGSDLHVHGYPEALVDVGWDFAWEAKQAYDAGMRAIVFKSMHIDTAPATYFVQQLVDIHAAQCAEQTGQPVRPFNAFGGVVLNFSAGGLNPIAVETSLKVGAKITWLPSHDSAHHMKVLGEGGGVEVIGEDDKPLPNLVEIMKLIAEHNTILDLCHTSTKERFVITEAAPQYGVEKILLTHPQWSVNRMSIEQMVEISKMGAYIGLWLYSAFPHFNNPVADRTEVLRIIEAVGPERICIASDFGSMLNPPPVEGLKLYIRLLLAMGVSKQDIRTMLVTNPANLLGIS
jgi:hypothetical protein